MGTSAVLVARSQSSSTVLGHSVLGVGLSLLVFGTVGVTLSPTQELVFEFFAHPPMLLLGLLLMATRVAARLTRPGISGLDFTFDSPSRCVAGATAEHRLSVQNGGRRWSPFVDLSLRSPGFSDVDLGVQPMARGGVAEVVILRRAFWRAHVPSHRLAVVCGDRLGLSRTTTEFAFPRPIVIEPRLVEREIPDDRTQGGDDDGSRADRAGAQPFAVRPWRPGDSARQVHWRSTARRGELIVVEHAIPHQPRLALLVVGDGYRPATEALVSDIASFGVAGVRAGRQVLLLGAQPGLTTLDWASRDDVLDWCTGLGSPSLLDATGLDTLLRRAGPGGEVAVWTSVEMSPEWWTYVERAGGRRGVTLVAVTADSMVSV